MWELITADQNLPFSIALALMGGIAVLEGVTTLLGAGMSELVDTLVPEFDADVDIDVDIDADIDADLDVDGMDAADSLPALSQFMGWLNVGRVPVLILFVLFLLSFGLGGLFTQSAVSSLSGKFLPAAIASIPALAIALPSLHFLGGLFARIMPKDETEAVEELTLLGNEAEVVLGIARKGSAAQVKVKDSFGKTHYVMFEPSGDEEIPAGAKVILEDKEQAIFRGHRINS